MIEILVLCQCSIFGVSLGLTKARNICPKSPIWLIHSVWMTRDTRHEPRPDSYTRFFLSQSVISFIGQQYCGKSTVFNWNPNENLIKDKFHIVGIRWISYQQSNTIRAIFQTWSCVKMLLKRINFIFLKQKWWFQSVVKCNFNRWQTNTTGIKSQEF